MDVPIPASQRPVALAPQGVREPAGRVRLLAGDGARAAMRGTLVAR